MSKDYWLAFCSSFTYFIIFKNVSVQYLSLFSDKYFTNSSCASFDLKKQKKISLEDLFKPGYEKKLTAALNAAARKKYNVKKLSEALFVEEIELNGNFFVTGKGICFNYVPYEIASYAQGEQKIFVPFTALKAIMK